MIRISKEDLVALVKESFEEGFREGIQKGRGFQAVEWDRSHVKGRLETMVKKNSGDDDTRPQRSFLKPE